MLIEFSTANFLSIRDRQTLSLVKAKGGEMVESNTFKTVAHSEFELLRSAALLGPNASGKSSLLRALQTMRHLVLRSGTQIGHGDKLPITPFLLQEASRDAPSEFEMVFIADQVRYQYGFTATADRIHDEWLLAYPNGRAQHWFDRSWDEASQRYDWMFGGKLRGHKRAWHSVTRDNALFLSTAVRLNSKQLTPVWDWFRKTLQFESVSRMNSEISEQLREREATDRALRFLRAADFNIEDIIVESEHMSINTVHRDNDGNMVAFDLADEGSGLRKALSLANPWLNALSNGHVLVIDDLHDGLHHRLAEFMVRLFHNSKAGNAQLIFSTHGAGILNQRLLRRDQVWFCETDKEQATTLYPLSDFFAQKHENVAARYLTGRYGAVPYVKPLRETA